MGEDQPATAPAPHSIRQTHFARPSDRLPPRDMIRRSNAAREAHSWAIRPLRRHHNTVDNSQGINGLPSLLHH